VGTAVGYGMTGTGLSGSVTLDGKKRGEQNVIDQFQNSRLVLLATAGLALLLARRFGLSR
jgi:hypothetical protein